MVKFCKQCLLFTWKNNKTHLLCDVNLTIPCWPSFSVRNHSFDDPQFFKDIREDYLLERSEYRRTGISRKETLKRAEADAKLHHNVTWLSLCWGSIITCHKDWHNLNILIRYVMYLNRKWPGNEMLVIVLRSACCSSERYCVFEQVSL